MNILQNKIDMIQLRIEFYLLFKRGKTLAFISAV